MATNPSYTASTADDDSAESRTAVQKLRDQADAVVERIQPQIAAVSTYVRDEPTKALLISAAAGAALMGVIALIVRSSSRSSVPGAAAGRSAMAAIRDAALELADSAQSMALDAIDATRKRAADAYDTARQRAAGAYDASQSRAADALDATKSRAADALAATQKRAAAAADSVSETVADTWKKVRDQAAPVVDKIKPQLDAAAAYAREEPARTALGVAAAGAIIAGLIALARQADDDTFR